MEYLPLIIFYLLLGYYLLVNGLWFHLLYLMGSLAVLIVFIRIALGEEKNGG